MRWESPPAHCRSDSVIHLACALAAIKHNDPAPVLVSVALPWFVALHIGCLDTDASLVMLSQEAAVTVEGAVGGDASGISSLRCLILYLERLSPRCGDPACLPLVCITLPCPPTPSAVVVNWYQYWDTVCALLKQQYLCCKLQ